MFGCSSARPVCKARMQTSAVLFLAAVDPITPSERYLREAENFDTFTDESDCSFLRPCYAEVRASQSVCFLWNPASSCALYQLPMLLSSKAALSCFGGTSALAGTGPRCFLGCDHAHAVGHFESMWRRWDVPGDPPRRMTSEAPLPSFLGRPSLQQPSAACCALLSR